MHYSKYKYINQSGRQNTKDTVVNSLSTSYPNVVPLVGSESASRSGDPTLLGGPADCGEQGSHHILGSYRIINRNSNKTLIKEFRDYLTRTAKSSFIIHGIEYSPEPNNVDKEIDYIHRWTPTYRKSVIAKMYLLEKWHKENPLPLTMGTFTTYQDGKYSEQVVGRKTIEQSFALLKKSWNYVRMYLHFYYPDLEFVYFYEPHKTGYPHLHVLFFGELSESMQITIKRLWSEKYKAGSFEHGVHFDEIKQIKSIRNYMIKYFSKILRQSNNNDWTEGELFFNAIIWKKKYRLWGASRTISRAMKKPEQIHVKDVWEEDVEPSEYYWVYTELKDPNGDLIVVKKLENYDIENQEIICKEN